MSSSNNPFKTHNFPPEIVNRIFIDYIGDYLTVEGLTAEYASLRLIDKFFNAALRPLQRSLATAVATYCVRLFKQCLDQDVETTVPFVSLPYIKKHPQLLLNPMLPIAFVPAFFIRSVYCSSRFPIPRKDKDVDFITWSNLWQVIDLNGYGDWEYPELVGEVLIMKNIACEGLYYGTADDDDDWTWVLSFDKGEQFILLSSSDYHHHER
ncbi:hypothetical protein HDV00_011670 [Rhizophlyctis rosea]|nr:hypothetical protein HDV00_011670 [Rhizophlyctis rosea]